jgi:hypothetical protein
MDKNTFTLTSKLGRFTFRDDTLPSIAKLIRDSVTGQWFAPKEREPELHSKQDCYAYMGNCGCHALSAVTFDLEIKPEYLKTKRTRHPLATLPPNEFEKRVLKVLRETNPWPSVGDTAARAAKAFAVFAKVADA